MSESLILNHAARILATNQPPLPADAALRRYLGLARQLGPRERRAISLAFFNYHRWLKWVDPTASAQKQIEAALEIHERFLRDPKAVKTEALAVKAVPEWLKVEMELPAGFLRQIQHEPTLWLRARPGKAGALAHQLGDCTLPPPLPLLGAEPARRLDAIRYGGKQDLFLTEAFHAGAFEIQDLSSQLVGVAANPKPGQTWWDACAGEGGKTLHLADLMFNKGVVWATDRSARRLETLKRRTARAKLFNFRQTLWDGSARLPSKTKFDGILVDAPCSGVGTWQRNPHARWTVTPDDVRELATTQRALLEHVCGSLKPGGRLVYAVCTLTRSETTAVAAAFTAAHPELEPSPVFEDTGPTPGPATIQLWPQDLNANGMFIAAWKKKAEKPKV